MMPVVAAQYNCDRHVVKIILEAVEMMGFAYPEKEFLPLKWINHKNRHYAHPMSRWVRASKQNFDWTYQHTVALCQEFEFRYEHAHSYYPHVEWIGRNLPIQSLPDFGRTDWPRCFGEWKDKIELSDNAVHDYRRYYVLAKRFATWKKRGIPEWYK
jgi:hypothetical protein